MIPTDKEIEDEAKEESADPNARFHFLVGAKWMRDQIGKEEAPKTITPDPDTGWEKGWYQAMKIAATSFALGKDFGDTRKFDSFGDPVNEEWYKKGSLLHSKEEPLKVHGKQIWKSADIANLSDCQIASLLNNLTKQSFGEWQLCPKCRGTGFAYPLEPFTCDVCKGEKIIARPLIK